MTKPDTQFKDQGGAATMDPSVLRRWVVSRIMSNQASEQRMLAKRVKAEKKRANSGTRHSVEYFHQVDDGYSHLAAQVLERFCSRYNIELKCHLVSGPTGNNVYDTKLLSELGLEDARAISPHYDLNFPEINHLPSTDCVSLAQRILSAQAQDNFVRVLNDVSLALWCDDLDLLNNYAERYGCETNETALASVTDGNARRDQLKHYSGAMFYYEGEWYWGIDRLYHLENRLRELNLDSTPELPNLMPRQEINIAKITNGANLSLEIYVSLRSPYSAIAFDRSIRLAKEMGINYVIRPVLPMVMRGVPTSLEKGLYILFDTAREARAAGVPFGPIYDPIGQPVRNGYALYHWAKQYDKGELFFSNFLRAAFVERVNTNREKGLRYVVEHTGLDWIEAKVNINNTDWYDELEANRLTMLKSQLWGVPSFRLLDQDDHELLALWGQDRLWLLAKEIRRFSEHSHPEN